MDGNGGGTWVVVGRGVFDLIFGDCNVDDTSRIGRGTYLGDHPVGRDRCDDLVGIGSLVVYGVDATGLGSPSASTVELTSLLGTIPFMPSKST